MLLIAEALAETTREMTIAEVVVIGLVFVFMMLVLITLFLCLMPYLARGVIAFGEKRAAGKKQKQERKEEAVRLKAASTTTATAARNASVTTAATTSASQHAEEPQPVSGEIIAVIMAAICAAEEAQGVPAGKFRVVSFKRVGQRA